ncbi:hypothetical protein CK203_083380 [Vitis vinifera]|uniref:Retroviral polymerase SH3-like domain-containing protein n=1 Tax=Vitis vinifera TaxID=29760 RepID=A0A438BVZ0_VITVI|nr:hypothetical protein CK203_083380 [Vitis vinifera]
MKCMFLGNSATQKGYRCYYPKKHRCFTSIDVTFFENRPFYTKNSLQEEKESEENFWETYWETPIPLPSLTQFPSHPDFELPSQPSSPSLLKPNQSHSPHVSKPMMPPTNKQYMIEGHLLIQPELLVYS